MLSAVSKITKIYVLILFAVFPLFMTDKYYDIQNDNRYLLQFWSKSIALTEQKEKLTRTVNY